MNKLNTLFAGATLAAVAIIASASTPNPVSISGSNLVDADAIAYMASLGTVSPQLQSRIVGGYQEMKADGIWTNLVDGAVFGSTFNITGSSWITFKHRTGTSYGSPTVLSYGMAFNGTNQSASLYSLPDTRTNTLIVIVEHCGISGQSANGAIISLQNNASINGTEGIWTDNGCYNCGVGSGIFSYLRNVFPATYTNGVFPYNSGHPLGDARMVGNDDQEHTLAVSSDNHGKFTHFTDGWSLGVTNFSVIYANPLQTINIGAASLSDNVPFTSSYFKGTVKAWMLLSGPASTNQVKSAMAALRWFDPRDENLIFVGDSMTTPLQDAVRLNQNWPYQMMTLTSRSNTAFYRNTAINGTTAAQWPGWYSTYVSQFKPGGPVKSATIFYRLGPNDILSGGSDAPTTFYQMSNFWALAKADGFKIDTMTLTPATNYTQAPGKEAIRLALNSLIASNGPTYVDKVYRLDLVWNDPGATTWWTYDSLHQNGAGYLAIAQMIADDTCVPSTPYGGVIALADANNFFDSTHSNHMAGQLMADKGLIVLGDTSQLQPLATGTNIAVDFSVPVSIFAPTNNVFLIFSTNFSTAGSQDKLFKLKGSASNFTVKFGTDFTNLFGVYTTNGYILGNSNGPHLIAIHIDAAHGTETAAIVPPNN